MASGILEVLLVNAKGLGDTDFIGTISMFLCFFVYLFLLFRVPSYVKYHVFFSVFLILSSSLSWCLLFWLPKCVS